jgi:glutamine synthetase
MSTDEILRRCRDADTRMVRFLYCDNGGTIRGKASAMAGLAGRLADGIGLTLAMMAMNGFDQLQSVEGMSAVGEIRLVPDLDSFAFLPYAPRSAVLHCDMLTGTREPWDGCPRSFLKRMISRTSQCGLTLQASFEAEFTLATRADDGRFKPFDTALCFSTIGMTQAGPFADELFAALDGQNLIVEQYYPEYAHGQHEISIRHAEALRAADNHVKLRDTLRAVAWKHGLYASLAPKPFASAVGNGAHIHFSLWDQAGHNVFYDASTPDGLSLTGKQFLAGVKAHLPALVAVTCPSANSYQRLTPSAWASAFAAYGHDNREAALRIASPYWSDVEGSTNLELKAADSSCNPYLALGALLAAGLDGLDRQLDPGPPTEVDPASLSEEQRAAAGITRLPTSLDAAVDAFERDELLVQAFGELMARSFITVRRSEAAMFRDSSPEETSLAHFYRY